MSRLAGKPICIALASRIVRPLSAPNVDCVAVQVPGSHGLDGPTLRWWLRSLPLPGRAREGVLVSLDRVTAEGPPSSSGTALRSIRNFVEDRVGPSNARRVRLAGVATLQEHGCAPSGAFWRAGTIGVGIDGSAAVDNALGGRLEALDSRDRSWPLTVAANALKTWLHEMIHSSEDHTLRNDTSLVVSSLREGLVELASSALFADMLTATGIAERMPQLGGRHLHVGYPASTAAVAAVVADLADLAGVTPLDALLDLVRGGSSLNAIDGLVTSGALRHGASPEQARDLGREHAMRLDAAFLGLAEAADRLSPEARVASGEEPASLGSGVVHDMLTVLRADARRVGFRFPPPDRQPATARYGAVRDLAVDIGWDAERVEGRILPNDVIVYATPERWASFDAGPNRERRDRLIAQRPAPGLALDLGDVMRITEHPSRGRVVAI